MIVCSSWWVGNRLVQGAPGESVWCCRWSQKVTATTRLRFGHLDRENRRCALTSCAEGTEVTPTLFKIYLIRDRCSLMAKGHNLKNRNEAQCVDGIACGLWPKPSTKTYDCWIDVLILPFSTIFRLEQAASSVRRKWSLVGERSRNQFRSLWKLSLQLTILLGSNHGAHPYTILRYESITRSSSR